MLKGSSQNNIVRIYTLRVDNNFFRVVKIFRVEQIYRVVKKISPRELSYYRYFIIYIKKWYYIIKGIIVKRI